MNEPRSEQRFPRTHRIRTGKQFREIARRGQRHQDDLFTVQVQRNGLDHARLGLTVSRRVALRANRRNFIKRLIRESFRSHQVLLRGFDVVVVARAPASRAQPDQLRGSLALHWNAFK